MNKVNLTLFFLLIFSLVLAGCSSAPTATQSAPVATSAPTAAATKANYPAPTTNQPTPTVVVENQPSGYPAPNQATQAYPVPGSGLLVKLAGGASQTLTIDVLNSLATVTVNLEGQDQPYRKLGDVLAKAGAISYKTVTLTGQSNSLQLTSDQVAQAYLDVQAGGKVRVLVQGMPPAQWLTSVSMISVQ